MEITIQVPGPHAGQRAIIRSSRGRRRKYNVVKCGRRWGKSYLGINRICQAALSGLPCAWFAPNYSKLRPMMDRLESILKPVTERFSRQEKTIYLSTGGSITFWTCDGPDPALGQFYGCVVIDEAALIDNLEHIWEVCIEPTLLDLDGEAWILSTPRGYNYFRTLYQREADQVEGWAAYSAPTTSNPTIRGIREWVERKRKVTHERKFRQEYLAEFISDGGQVFRYLNEAATAPIQYAPNLSHCYTLGLDWGRSNDYTVAVVYDLTARSVAYVDRFTGLEFATQQTRIKALYDRFRPFCVLAESNSFGAANIEALQREGMPLVPFATTDKSKLLIIDNLILAFENKSLRILGETERGEDGAEVGKVVKEELMAFTSRTSTTGRTTYGAPPGQHDDTVIALALAYHAAQNSAPLSHDSV